MTSHAEDALRGSRIAQVLDLALAVSTTKTGGTESLVAREDSQIFDFVATGCATICTVIADKGSVAEEEEVCVRVEKCAACVTSEAVKMPSIASCQMKWLAFLEK